MANPLRAAVGMRRPGSPQHWRATWPPAALRAGERAHRSLLIIRPLARLAMLVRGRKTPLGAPRQQSANISNGNSRLQESRRIKESASVEGATRAALENGFSGEKWPLNHLQPEPSCLAAAAAAARFHACSPAVARRPAAVQLATAAAAPATTSATPLQSVGLRQTDECFAAAEHTLSAPLEEQR